MSYQNNKPNNTLSPSYISCVGAFVMNMSLAYVVYTLCRLIFIAVNYQYYKDGWEQLSMGEVFGGGLLFDTSAILYTNSLYALMMLLPFHFKERRVWQNLARWLFIIVNSAAVIVNLADSVYFTYTGRRSTTSVLGEFSNEGNIALIIGTELLNHWYLVIAGLILIFILCKFSVKTEEMRFYSHGRESKKVYYVFQVVALLIFVPLCVAGMRGGFTTAVRPITISNANQYVNHPNEAAMVLNTPFSLIRTVGKNVFVDPKYMSDSEMNALYSPVFNATADTTAQTAVAKRKNVVVLIVESFGREYIGKYNEMLEGGKYKGYAPFIDELYEQSLSFDYTFANGRKSIDGMPSILSGIPHFVEPFFLTPASMNNVGGLACELGKCGYSSAFFHGAENGSMGFEAFARTTGYQKYYGRKEFNEDKRFRGDHDFDGTWAIWDEPFLQFYALKMTEMKEPFVTTVFTASSHHPYAVPEEYKSRFPEEGKNPIHKCIRYTDMSLRRFFETAKKQPWYNNTIFVFTSDHTNILDHDEYATDLGVFGAPILFFDPSGDMPRGRWHSVAQQIDIMPTVLSYLGYNKPYVAFGKNLLITPRYKAWAVNYSNGIYQYVKNGYVIQFDGSVVKAAYDYKEDWMMKHNLVKQPEHQAAIKALEKELKAVIQSYMQRMTTDNLIVR